MTSTDVCIVLSVIVLAGLSVAAMLSAPVIDLRDDEYPQGPFYHANDARLQGEDVARSDV